MKYRVGLLKIIGLAFLLPLVLNKLAFSKTVRLYKDYHHVQSLEVQLIQRSLSDSTYFLPLSATGNIISNGRFVENIENVCVENSVTMVQYEPKLLDKEGSIELYAASLILSGNYIDLVKTLKHVENRVQSIKISSLKFEYDEKRMKDKKIEMIAIINQIED